MLIISNAALGVVISNSAYCVSGWKPAATNANLDLTATL